MPQMYYNPYVMGSPAAVALQQQAAYVNSHPPSSAALPPPSNASPTAAAPSQGISSQMGASYRAFYPQFSEDAKVQIGASHLSVTSAQEEHLRQIRALQSLFGYTSSIDNDYAVSLASYSSPSNAVVAAATSAPSAPSAAAAAANASRPQVVPKGTPPSTNPDAASASASTSRSPLTKSVDYILHSGSKDTFLEEQERLLREFNIRKAEADERALREATHSPSAPATSGVLIVDEANEEAIFDELLRSENPNADIFYPALVMPELVEALDEKLRTRIVDAHRFAARARAFSNLDFNLWNLTYTFKHLTRLPTAAFTSASTAAGNQHAKEPTRRSYLISSRGRREPLEESVGKDWQLLTDSTSPIDGGNNNSSSPSQIPQIFPPYVPNGRFQYPQNMVTFDNTMAYSVRPVQVAKDKEIEKSLYDDNVDLLHLQSFCLGYGVPKRLRAFVWQLMLGYLPTKSSERGRTLRARRIEYYDHFDKFLSERVSLTKQDRTMYNLVLVDVPRTHPDGYHALFNKPAVQASLERILYVWARNHPETSYYQGLNDLASVLMVVMLECCLPDLADIGTAPGQQELMEHLGLPAFESTFLASNQCNEALETALFCVEADTYHCLKIILDRVKEYHLFSSGGVYSESMIVHFEELVKRADPELHHHIAASELMYIQFAFRWMLCFFTRELETRNLVCLWDSYIVEQVGFPIFHIYVCVAYLIELRKQLIGQDMITILGFLQHAPTGAFTKHDIHRLVQNAAELYNRYPLNITPIPPLQQQLHLQQLQQQKAGSRR